MTDELKNVVNEQQPNDVDTAEDYISAIKNIKQNSVDRAQYEAVRSENKKLLDALVNNGLPAAEEVTEARTYRSKEELNRVMNDTSTTNLEYFKALLELRDRTIELEGYDPAIPHGIGPNGPIKPQYGEAEAIADQLELLQKLVDEAGNDNNAFNVACSRAAR